MSSVALLEQKMCAVAEDKLWNAVDGIDQSRTRPLSEADLSEFELLITAQRTPGAAPVSFLPLPQRSALDEIKDSGSLDVDRWATLVTMAEMRAHSDAYPG